MLRMHECLSFLLIKLSFFSVTETEMENVSNQNKGSSYQAVKSIQISIVYVCVCWQKFRQLFYDERVHFKLPFDIPVVSFLSKFYLCIKPHIMAHVIN